MRISGAAAHKVKAAGAIIFTYLLTNRNGVLRPPFRSIINNQKLRAIRGNSPYR